MPTVDVCLSPHMLHLYEIKHRTVVIVDILRATSCMVTAFAHGVDHIIPFANLDNCRKMNAHGYITSGERNGEKVEGFDKGNSPFEYMEDMRGKKIAFTTTNGTEAIDRSLDAAEIVIASFLNLSAVADRLLEGRNDVLIVCAGWKGKFNLEDSIFAGALVSKITRYITPECDAPLAAMHLYQTAKRDMNAFMSTASHVQRLKRLNITEDVAFCMTEDRYQVVPFLEGEKLVERRS